MGKSSKDKRDVYYRQAKEGGWRARSAFKLLQIHEEYEILFGVKKAVDLCAAPGSWSQVLSRKISRDGTIPDVKIVAVDIQKMAPLPGVVQIQGDITEMDTVKKILAEFQNELVDIVVFDGAPDVTGIHDLDEFIQGQLLLAAINITTFILKKGGIFLGKIFRGGDCSMLKAKLAIFFKNVMIIKPKSSRNSSTEAFVLCREFELPEGYVPNLINPLLHNTEVNWNELNGVNRYIVPFMCCGDLCTYDSDKGSSMIEMVDLSYTLTKPKDPPYSEAQCTVTKRGEHKTKKSISE